ncbi:helix-turn-helix transcriptional regulator [Agrobacterium larrymoorei]|uniref:AraC family transcriptional regulator n=1 Tax=Agrobacterium larrymoorei TaxID=160699 RepID=A0AAF0H8J6_9HYPH|nr:AraC family transcriptional regulator [Agrobacterium larrymoorei]WHA39849.1 AraC family transcriptional regulator [Agrobacterium larrymoorei]
MRLASADLRSYSSEKPPERHGFVQIVLPLSGHLEIDVRGLQENLSPTKGVLIQGNTPHSQRASGSNHSLIVDLDEELVPERTLETFASSPYIDLSRHSISLAHHMRFSLTNGDGDPEALRLWAELLVGSFIEEKPDMAARLLILKRMIEIDPFQPWTVEHMAAQTEISTSRLHTLFRDYFDATPHLWLADARMKKICALLSNSALPIAEIAQRAGFSDQTALTRAMKKSLGTTPAAYRRNRFS